MGNSKNGENGRFSKALLERTNHKLTGQRVDHSNNARLRNYQVIKGLSEFRLLERMTGAKRFTTALRKFFSVGSVLSRTGGCSYGPIL